jgi:hypothetical protein
MNAAPLTRFHRRINGAGRFAPMMLERLVKIQWRIGLAHCVFPTALHQRNGARSAMAEPPGGTSPTDQRNQRGARAARDIAETQP